MAELVVIGIDSATFDIIDPLVAQGKLPVLSRLKREGVWGRLTSTVPPVTPPAWTSFMTGMNPGKHGIFDFSSYTTHGYERPLVSSKSIKAKTLWRILSENGNSVGVINVPLTYPPEKVNGFIIPGMQYALDVKTGFTYPQQLLEEIEHRFGRYEVVYGDERALYTDELDLFIQRWKEITEKRQKVILYLLEKYNPDVFMPVFYCIDPIQHHFWKFYDRAHPQYNHKLAAKYKGVIPEFYQILDKYVGEILERVGKDTTTLILSDHGAGPYLKGVFINKWLMQKGLLKIKYRYLPLIKIKWPHMLFKVLRRFGHPAIAWTIPMSLYSRLKNDVDPREGLRLSEIIDWKRTKVYAGNYTEQGVYINYKGREVNGIVDEKEYSELKDYLIKSLYDLIDPLTDERVVDQVIRREDIYSGSYSEFAADLFVGMGGGTVLLQKGIHNGLFLQKPHMSGTHRAEGILIAHGENIKNSLILSNPRIVDLAPTILYLMGCPVPMDMDGRVLREIIKDEFINGSEVQFGPPAGLEDQDDLYTQQEEEKIKEILRQLGYYA